MNQTKPVLFPQCVFVRFVPEEKQILYNLHHCIASIEFPPELGDFSIWFKDRGSDEFLLGKSNAGKLNFSGDQLTEEFIGGGLMRPILEKLGVSKPGFFIDSFSSDLLLLFQLHSSSQPSQGMYPVLVKSWNVWREGTGTLFG